MPQWINYVGYCYLSEGTALYWKNLIVFHIVGLFFDRFPVVYGIFFHLTVVLTFYSKVLCTLKPSFSMGVSYFVCALLTIGSEDRSRRVLLCVCVARITTVVTSYYEFSMYLKSGLHRYSFSSRTKKISMLKRVKKRKSKSSYCEGRLRRFKPPYDSLQGESRSRKTFFFSCGKLNESNGSNEIITVKRKKKTKCSPRSIPARQV